MITDAHRTSADDMVVSFINTQIPQKYGKVADTSLVLLLSSRSEGGGSIDVFKIRERIALEAFPFDRIMIVAVQADETIVFGELWPEFGALYYIHDEFDRFSK